MTPLAINSPAAQTTDRYAQFNVDTMKRNLLILIFIVCSSFVYSQDDWSSWNENYNEINIKKIISKEKAYADSVDNGLIDGKYYIRMSTYRFDAIYTGEKRKISENVKSSMRRVYKTLGNPEHLAIIDNIEHEFKFLVEDEEYWFPIQIVLEKPLKKENKRGEVVHLYCLFLNEHDMEGILYNSFFISEFKK